MTPGRGRSGRGSGAARARRVLVLTHADLLPPPRARAPRAGSAPVPWGTEREVLDALARRGHVARIVGLNHDLAPLDEALSAFDPHVVLNLLEEFDDRTDLAPAVVGYLELLGWPVTGCSARGLVLAQHKGTAKRLLQAAGVATAPGVVVGPRDALGHAAAVGFPAVVKAAAEHGSVGLTPASVVHGARALRGQVRRLTGLLRGPVLVERYVPGRELYVGVLPGPRPRALPPFELHHPGDASARPWIATERTKWDPRYLRRRGLRFGPAAALRPAQARTLRATALAAVAALDLNGPARVDLRWTGRGSPTVIEVNPNPDLISWGEYAQAAQASGLSYDGLIQRLLDHALAL